MGAENSRAPVPLPIAMLYRAALAAFPPGLRNTFATEMMAAFEMGYAARRLLGRAPALRFARRAWVDALATGIRERWRPGGVGAHGPRHREAGPKRWRRDHIAGLAFDLRLAWRAIVAAPAFSLTVLLMLGLGVGVNAALFGAVRTVLLQPPPYPDPERLVLLDLQTISTDKPGPGRAFPWSYPKYRILAGAGDLVAAPVAAYAVRQLALTGRGDAVRLDAEVVSPAYFDILRVYPDSGRWFSPEQAAAEVVLSYALWQERFDPEAPVLGQSVTISGQPLQVVGVAPSGFRGLSGRAQLWIAMPAVPTVVSTSLLDNAEGHWLGAIGRLRAGTTMEALRAQMQAIGAAVWEQYPWTDPTVRVSGGARTLAQARRNPQAQRAVLVVSGAALLVLLIACTNLAALMVARSADRRRDIAVRLALGGSRLRVIRGLIAETLLLSLGGAALGVLVASLTTAALARAWPATFINGDWNVRFVDAASLQMSASVALVALALALLTGLAFSIGPILRLTATRADLAGQARAASHHTRTSGRRLLVAGEVALTLVLLVGAALMTTSLGKLLGVDRGFDSHGLLRFRYVVARTLDLENPARFHDEFLSRVRALPGVISATQGTAPLGGHDWISGVRRAGDVIFEEGHRPATGISLIDEEFFATLRVPLLAGRVFTAQDGADSPPMVILNQTAARTLFPDQDPIGQPFATGVSLTQDGRTAEVIGIVGDVLYDPPALGTMSEAYFLHRQEPGREAVGIVRAANNPYSVLPSVRALLAEMAPEIPLAEIATIDDLGAAQTSDSRVLAALLSAFAALATALAATGLWGVVAYAVSGRARELGVRMALGASAGALVRLVVRQGLASLLAGAFVGAVGAALLSRTLGGLLYGVEPTAPGPFVGGLIVLVAVCSLASYIPARRASRLDPVRTLRVE